MRRLSVTAMLPRNRTGRHWRAGPMRSKLSIMRAVRARRGGRQGGRGFTLVEVLVALLVFSIGMVGVAGLMVVAVKGNQGAYLRTQAGLLAQSMAERIRANRSAITEYNGLYDASSAGTDPCVGGVPCAPAQRVARDRAQWSRELARSLPAARAEVDCEGSLLGSPEQAAIAPFAGLCAISIAWDASALQTGAGNSANGAQLESLSWVFQP